MSDAPSPAGPPNAGHDFSGLPTGTAGDERSIGTGLRAAVLLVIGVIGLGVMLAGAALSAGSAEDQAKASAVVSGIGVGETPAFTEFFIERIGLGMLVFGAATAALATVMAAWSLLGPGVRVAVGPDAPG